MKTVVIASSNSGKLQEIQASLGSLPIKLFPQTDFAVASAPETGLTFVENAIIKARHAAAHTELPALADDSGLVVKALGGAPGIYSARYAGENANDEANCKKLLGELLATPFEERDAKFYCVMVLLKHANDPSPLICYGSWEGKILLKPQGKYGFGYDPIFYVPSHQCSAAELPLEIKNTISHRGQALQQLTSTLQTYL